MASRKRNKNRSIRRQKRLTLEALEARQLLASDWQNPGQAWDVSRDLTISPIDALLGINRLNSGVPKVFPARAVGSTEPYFDVSGDGEHSPIDVLLVINALNRALPTVSVELLKDSGSGTGAASDRVSADLSVRGNISRAKATELWGRFGTDPNWHRLKTYPSTVVDQSFSFNHDEIVTAFGGLPTDGPVTMHFQPRYGVNNAEVGSEADLTVTLDLTAPQFSFEVRPNFLGAISMSVPNLIEVPLNEKVSPGTLIPSKVSLFDTTFSTPEPLTARSIAISNDGRFLLIEPPTNSQSISYSVSIQEGAFEDLAGNLAVSFEATAHLFSDVSQTPLALGQKTDFSSTQRAVKEYTFDLTSSDLFMLTGLEAAGEMQLELFSPSGQLLRVWATDTVGGSLELGAANWAMLTELGEYTLRLSVPAATTVSLRAALSKGLPTVPASSQLQGTFTWSESQAFVLDVTTQDRLYFENNLNPLTSFRAILLNQYGQELSSTELLASSGDSVYSLPSAGRYIVLIEALTTERPDSYDFTVHLSETTEVPLTFGQFQENTLTTPGQLVFYTFAAQAARTYTIEIESDFGDVAIGLPGIFEVNQAGAYPVEESGDGFVLLAFNRADIPSTRLRFRLVESITTVTPPLTKTVHTETLQQGVTQRLLLVEQESYEFTFTGTSGELYAFRELIEADFSLYELVAPTGSIVEPTEQAAGTRIYRIPYGGQYRLRATGEIGTQLDFQWQKLSTAPVLGSNAAIQGSMQQEAFAVYRFAANNTRFFAYPTASADGLTWKLIDENGQVIVDSDFNLDLASDMVTGGSYWLIIEKQDAFASTSFEFQRRNTANAARNGTVGTTISGNLPTRGDRVVIEFSLVAGQLLDLTSNLDPSFARVRWLDYSINSSDGPIEIDPSVPTLIGSTRKYRVEIQNLTEVAVAYSIKFDALQPPLTPPATLGGFDQIQSGTVDNAPQIFNFNVSAGARYLFDWLLEENSNIQVDIVDPSGSISSSLVSGTDSLLTTIETAGVLTVQITNFGLAEQPFSFRMISPSTAEAVTLGTKKSATVIPYGTAFFNIALGSTTEVFLQSAANADSQTALYRLNSLSSSGIAYEGPFISGQFLAGDAFVWATNGTANDYLTEFTAFSVASIPEAQLNSPVILQTAVDVGYLLPFKTTVADSVIGANGFIVLDQAGVPLDSIRSGTAYRIAQPGEYRAFFVASGETTQIEVHTQVEANSTATLGTAESGVVDKVGDVNRYSIALTAGAPILLTIEMPTSGLAQWVAPSGQIESLLFNGSTLLPVYTSGTYQLEVYSLSNALSYKFELNDLSQAVAISPGQRTGNTGPGIIEIQRLVATPHQLMELQDASEQQVQLSIIDRLGNLLPQVSFAGRLFNQMPADGVGYILVKSLPGDTAVDYAYFADLVSTQTQPAPIGQIITGTLASRLEGKSYTFTVAQPTWVRIGSATSDSALLVLKMADGSLRSSPEGFFGLLLAGQYEVAVYNEARTANNFTMTIDLLNQAPAITLNQVTNVVKTGRYRVDVAAEGRFELQLRNSSNLSLDPGELTVTNLNGAEVTFDPRGILEAGSYWVTFNPASTLPAGDYRLTLATITTTESNLTPGTLGEFALNANGLQEHLVTVQVLPGMRLFVDELEFATGGSIEVRFNNGVIGDWVTVDALPQILSGSTGEETLQFRIRGTGLARIHLIDLNAAPALTLGGSTSLELNSRRRGRAWLMGGNVGDIVDFINSSSAEKPAQWMVIDEAGNVVTRSVNQPFSFAIVNRQRLSLVIVANEPLAATLSIAFQTIVS